MTKKDFELIARTIARLPLAPQDIGIIADDFADALRSTNPAFNKDRFLAACDYRIYGEKIDA